MTVAVAPTPAAATDPAVQQLLMRFIGALNRRRAYAATHPMVIAAEEQLHESATSLMRARPVITIGVAKADLLIDGEPYTTRSSFARELATRLHRRGVGAVTLRAGVPLLQLRETLAWLATEPAPGSTPATDIPPVLSGISVTPVAYDQLTLGDADRAAEASASQLWRSLALLAGDGASGREGMGQPAAATPDRDAIARTLHGAIAEPDVARRTAIAFMDLASQGSVAPVDARARIGEQLNTALDRLGASSFGPVIRALGDRSMQQRFVSQVADVLPVAAVANWLQVAAEAQEQQMSHHMLRLMSKLSTFADESGTASAEAVFRGAAQDLVKGWALDDPNPAEHVALLDRIAMHERAQQGKPAGTGAIRIGQIESTRLIQMALEIDVAGEDAIAAAQSIVADGSSDELLMWVDAVKGTATARTLTSIAISEQAVRQLLLTEPVDRLRARVMLDHLDASYAPTLLDVLEAAEARGTRMIVRQRLSEFGAAIVPTLLSRLDDAPWYLVRNILTLLHENAEHQGGSAAGVASMLRLMDHDQVQVRTEAFRVLLLDDATRDTAIHHALQDSNERMVVLALQALAESGDASSGLPTSLPRAIVAQLMEMVDSGRASDSVRARMVRTLSGVHDDTVRDWLITLVVRRSRILRRLALADPTSTAVAAVHALQRTYAADPVAQPILALVRKEGHDRRWVARDPGAAMEHAS